MLKINALAAVAVTSVSVPAFAMESQAPLAAVTESGWQLWLTPGLSTGKLDWNIAAPGGSPNVLSELVFDDIKAVNIEAGARYLVKQGRLQGLILQGYTRYGVIHDGTAHDRDWISSDRTDLFSYSTADIKDDQIDRLNLAAGYRWSLSDRIQIDTLIGYERNRQQLWITNGYQRFPAMGPFGGLNNRYDATWDSGWLGLEGHMEVAPTHHLDAGIQYHRMAFEAEATWNLRPEFAQPNSFAQEADGGNGVRLHLNYRKEIAEHWQLMLGLEWERFKVTDGEDYVNFVQPGVFTVRSPLNEARWRQLSYSAGVVWSF